MYSQVYVLISISGSACETQKRAILFPHSVPDAGDILCFCLKLFIVWSDRAVLSRVASLDSLFQVNDTLAVHGSHTFEVLVPYRASFRFMCEHACTGVSDPIPREILHDHPPALVEDVLVQ